MRWVRGGLLTYVKRISQAEIQRKLVKEGKLKVKHSKRRTKVVELQDTSEERAAVC